MRKLIDNIKKYPKVYLITSIISMVVGVVIFCLFFFLGNQKIIPALNGTGVAAVILFGVGVLCVLARFGAFDTFSYGFKQMFASWFNKEANKFNDMAEYKEEKNRVRSTGSYYYLAILFVSLLFFIAFIALEIYKGFNYNF